MSNLCHPIFALSRRLFGACFFVRGWWRGFARDPFPQLGSFSDEASNAAVHARFAEMPNGEHGWAWVPVKGMSILDLTNGGAL